MSLNVGKATNYPWKLIIPTFSVHAYEMELAVFRSCEISILFLHKRLSGKISGAARQLQHRVNQTIIILFNVFSPSEMPNNWTIIRVECRQNAECDYESEFVFELLKRYLYQFNYFSFYCAWFCVMPVTFMRCLRKICAIPTMFLLQIDLPNSKVYIEFVSWHEIVNVA